LDWKASTGYGSADFAALAAGTGSASEIRGWLKQTDYYTSVFPEAEFQSYRFSSPDQNTSIWAYSRRDSDSHREIDMHFKGGNIIAGSDEAKKFTLRLERGSEGAAPNQWAVAELLHKEWIEP
jgi:hypothetical protein